MGSWLNIFSNPTALLLWEVCCVPSLLHGVCSWAGVTAATEKKSNRIQDWFLRLVLQIGPGTSLAALSWDFSMVNMSLRIKIEEKKLMFILYVRNLGSETLARKVYEEQKLIGWPGLAAETKLICQDLKFEDCNSTNFITVTQ